MNDSNDRWRPLTERDLTPEVLEEINQESPNISALRTWIIGQFSEQNPDSQINGFESSPQGLLVSWLWYQYEKCDLPVFVRKWPRLHHLIFSSFSDKMSGIAQRHCHICRSTEPLGPNFISFFALLRVRGISHQSARSETLRDLTREVKNRLIGRNLSANSALRFCLALTFVVNKSRKDRDLDNMAKATQDAVSRALNFDDARIVHLDVVKLAFSDAEECVYLRLATSSLNTHNDVVGAYFNHSFGGQQPLQVKY